MELLVMDALYAMTPLTTQDPIQVRPWYHSGFFSIGQVLAISVIDLVALNLALEERLQDESSAVECTNTPFFVVTAANVLTFANACFIMWREARHPAQDRSMTKTAALITGVFGTAMIQAILTSFILVCPYDQPETTTTLEI